VADRVTIDAAVHLEPSLAFRFGQHQPCAAQLVHRMRDEFLPAEAGVDRRDQQEIQIGNNLAHRSDGRRRIDGDAGPATKRPAATCAPGGGVCVATTPASVPAPSMLLTSPRLSRAASRICLASLTLLPVTVGTMTTLGPALTTIDTEPGIGASRPGAGRLSMTWPRGASLGRSTTSPTSSPADSSAVSASPRDMPMICGTVTVRWPPLTASVT